MQTPQTGSGGALAVAVETVTGLAKRIRSKLRPPSNRCHFVGRFILIGSLRCPAYYTIKPFKRNLNVANPLMTEEYIDCMDVPSRMLNGSSLSESSIVLIGLLFGSVGLVFRDSFGIASLFGSIGIGLIVAGTVYIAVEGSELVRLSIAFAALVALPLLLYRGIVQLIGGFLILIVLSSALYSRVSP